MAFQVETRDCAALTDGDLDEMASMGGAFDIGALSKAKEDWVLSTTARDGGKLVGFTFSTLERIGGTGFGIAWLSPDGLPPPLAALHAALAAGLSREGFAVERRMFRPHLTLARHCARAAQRGAVVPVRWTVDRLTLVESTLAAGGSRYRDVVQWRLSAVPGTESLP